jgi:hypothetical protein
LPSFLLQRKWYWYGTLTAWFTVAESVPGSHGAADLVREDVAIHVGDLVHTLY